MFKLKEKRFYYELNDLLNELNKKYDKYSKNENRYDMDDLEEALEIMKEDNSIEIIETNNKKYIILKPYWRHIFVNSILEHASENKIVKGAVSIEDLINLNFEVKFDKPLKKEQEKIDKEEKIKVLILSVKMK